MLHTAYIRHVVTRQDISWPTSNQAHSQGSDDSQAPRNSRVIPGQSYTFVYRNSVLKSTKIFLHKKFSDYFLDSMDLLKIYKVQLILIHYSDSVEEINDSILFLFLCSRNGPDNESYILILHRVGD